MTEYRAGEVVEVVRDPVAVDVLGVSARWVETVVEDQPARMRDLGFTADGLVYVRIDGYLVSRTLNNVRKVAA